ncbi:MAG: hypothetical protein KF802_12550 [Bdellovibrionaceae bacterium]|nr:hypothetical protein [Pseudobdellovibrionaceae bacterium]MBX3034695.1 hypothetical protein [Pseudobdellovibrionaceae bacterium]
MAKVLLVTEKLTPTAHRLALSLRQQHHQVTLLTSRDEDAALPDGIELLRPFRQWSFFEGMRVLPVIYGLQPQIVHLVLEEDQLKPAQILISLTAKTLPHCVLTTSLLHIRRGLRRRNPVRYLLQESDIVTCPTVESLGAMRGLAVKSTRQGRGLLPPVLDMRDDEDNGSPFTPGVELQKNLADEPYVVLPFFESAFDPQQAPFRRLALLAQHRHVVMLGSCADWSLRERKLFQAWMQAQGLDHRWTLSGDLSAADQRRLLSHSEAFCLAGLNLTAQESTEYFLRAIRAGATLILDDKQAALHGDLWKNGDNCWVVPKEPLIPALQQLLTRDGSLRRPQSLPQDLNLHRDLIDAPMNELNRLYNKALAHKHIS